MGPHYGGTLWGGHTMGGHYGGILCGGHTMGGHYVGAPLWQKLVLMYVLYEICDMQTLHMMTSQCVSGDGIPIKMLHTYIMCSTIH